jgi:hypothetical protein
LFRSWLLLLLIVSSDMMLFWKIDCYCKVDKEFCCWFNSTSEEFVSSSRLSRQQARWRLIASWRWDSSSKVWKPFVLLTSELLVCKPFNRRTNPWWVIDVSKRLRQQRKLVRLLLFSEPLHTYPKHSNKENLILFI